MKILSIDPGYEKVGIAVIQKEGGKEMLVFSECFKTSARLPHHERIRLVGDEVRARIAEYAPDAFAIETLFFNKNQKTVMNVSEARGVMVYEAARAGVHIYEYSPLQIKIALTGYGRGEKSQVIRMVRALVEIDAERAELIKEDDEFDAIAVGLTHCAHAR